MVAVPVGVRVRVGEADWCVGVRVRVADAERCVRVGVCVVVGVCDGVAAALALAEGSGRDTVTTTAASGGTGSKVCPTKLLDCT